jgi:hypothetical protein
MTESTNTKSELVASAFAALFGLAHNEPPLDSGLHNRFLHRVIAHVVRTALQEQSHFEETLLARVLWSFPDVPLRYDDFEYVLGHLIKRGEVQFRDGEYSLTPTEVKVTHE